MPAKSVIAKILAPLGLKSATDIGVKRRSWAMPDARRTWSLESLFALLAFKLGDSVQLENPSKYPSHA